MALKLTTESKRALYVLVKPEYIDEIYIAICEACKDHIAELLNGEVYKFALGSHHANDGIFIYIDITQEWFDVLEPELSDIALLRSELRIKDDEIKDLERVIQNKHDAIDTISFSLKANQDMNNEQADIIRNLRVDIMERNQQIKFLIQILRGEI